MTTRRRRMTRKGSRKGLSGEYTLCTCARREEKKKEVGHSP